MRAGAASAAHPDAAGPKAAHVVEAPTSRDAGTPRGVTGAVALGGALGASLSAVVLETTGALLAFPDLQDRLDSAGALSAALPTALPLLLVNLLGSFLLGVLLGRSRRAGPAWRPGFVAGAGTGFLGAFTTVSSAVLLAVHALQWTLPGFATARGIGGFLAASLAALGPVLLVLTVMAALSTAVAVLGLRLGGRAA